MGAKQQNACERERQEMQRSVCIEVEERRRASIGNPQQIACDGSIRSTECLSLFLAHHNSTQFQLPLSRHMEAILSEIEMHLLNLWNQPH